MKVGLVLEGGACKGIFTAGVLDHWMKNDVYFPYVVSVSAGTCNALDYLSNQPERTKNCMIPNNKKDRYYGFSRFIRSGHMLDLKRVFEEYPVKQFPFDTEAYMQSDIVNEMVVTNCLNGEAGYLSEKEDAHKLFEIAKASCSLPLLSEMVTIDGVPYLDGGMADSVPIQRAFMNGCDKVVVVLTHNDGYVPQISDRLKRIYVRKYTKYPHLLETILNRPKMYAGEMELLDQYVKEGKVFVVKPGAEGVRRLERNMDRMNEFYQLGYQRAEESFDQLQQFMLPIN